mmetsp:Transcript_30735/g.35040  ORF Transcript_30735/g.35040 Transcript_30735/m.35040 type:complete len:511 (+) Transcript_30735:51-1583(+)|eukprot:CAMPEP_0194146588 /NCGR_PEP_ID=MMETSP0152-20130528/20950_1 /TAXON_ID=1049557 /ORGANISM="Thalassiothrix antarctica, Strain L6-D1" /LENGTH=510 /DNA_ID=CAMNT_0038847139 /DNA_START=29 /DNA_END=1561 /DNA_ORIENTATION=+
MVANDADSCVPTQVTDFIFDLSDSVTLSQIVEEQSNLYSVTFRELCSKYFATSQWPSPQSIASECNGHPLFLAIYAEVTHRHWHSVSRPTVRDRIEGWGVYRELFEELLDEENVETRTPSFYLLPDWSFDILHEFVYQFQGFCQFKAAVYASAKKHNVNIDHATDGPHHLLENLNHLQQNPDAWSVDSVTYYLQRLIAVSKSASAQVGYQYLGIFSSIALSRLECLLGDYHGCLESASWVASGSMFIIDNANEWSSAQVMQSVLGARLSYAYHAGISYLMLRRYKDAAKVLGSVCIVLQRGIKTGLVRKMQGGDQFSKQYDRMVALLAILTRICPSLQHEGNILEESLVKWICDKHHAPPSKDEATYLQDLFTYACPKFVSPCVGHDAYKLQQKQFMNQMKNQVATRAVRSYMKLYAQMEVSKLAQFNDADESDFVSLLLCYKHKMHQLELGNGEELKGKSALDIHYHLNGSMVHVDEAEKQRRFENYFLSQIAQNEDIMKDVKEISTQI